MRKPYLIIDSKPGSGKHKMGCCTHCGNPTTKEELFKEEDVILIEKYCSDCLQSENFSSIMTFYASNENPAAK